MTANNEISYGTRAGNIVTLIFYEGNVTAQIRRREINFSPKKKRKFLKAIVDKGDEQKVKVWELHPDTSLYNYLVFNRGLGLISADFTILEDLEMFIASVEQEPVLHPHHPDGQGISGGYILINPILTGNLDQWQVLGDGLIKVSIINGEYVIYLRAIGRPETGPIVISGLFYNWLLGVVDSFALSGIGQSIIGKIDEYCNIQPLLDYYTDFQDNMKNLRNFHEISDEEESDSDDASRRYLHLDDAASDSDDDTASDPEEFSGEGFKKGYVLEYRTPVVHKLATVVFYLNFYKNFSEQTRRREIGLSRFNNILDRDCKYKHNIIKVVVNRRNGEQKVRKFAPGQYTRLLKYFKHEIRKSDLDGRDRITLNEIIRFINSNSDHGPRDLIPSNYLFRPDTSADDASAGHGYYVR